MKRRTFLQGLTAAGGIALFTEWPVVACSASREALLENFKTPPIESNAKAWWHWINGNVSSKGITLDLEFMKKMGLGGFHLFEVGAGIPPGPVTYGSPERLQLLEHAARNSDRLGLEFSMMNCPGWSSSGGPWITPELSMQQLTWSETKVSGGRMVDVILPQPYTKHGYYRDAFVLAFPSLPGEAKRLAELLSNVTSSSGHIDANLLTGSDLSRAVEINPAQAGHAAYFQLEFAEPFEACSIAVYLFRATHPGASIAAGPRTVSLEASDDGVRFRKICGLAPTFNIMSHLSGGQSLEVPVSRSFPRVRARFYRLVISTASRVGGLRLTGATYITDWVHKANFAHRKENRAAAPESLRATGNVPSKSVIDPASVMDLTHKMDFQGRIRWVAPAGDWTILRFGQTTTGMVNHPAPDGGLGLECDKYSRTAYDFHFRHYFGKLLPFIRPLAAKGKAGAVIDSYEVGMQTWTAEFPQGFQSRRGYDLRKYMPALTGRVVGSGEISDRFLWDFRRTCADLMADNYYGQFVEQCHQHGMKAYAEAYSGGPFEEIQAASRVDVPMGEFWAAQDDKGIAYSIKMSSSAAHVFGKRIVAAESYTSFPQLGKWQGYPYALKALGDWMYTQGLNELFLVEDYMEPHPTAKPGMNCSWGSMLSRTNTWFNKGGDWLRYVSRCQSMLRQGLLVADLIYFTGADVPVRTPVRLNQLRPAPPAGYYYDVTNSEGILNRMKADRGRIVLPDGMNYRILVLPEQRRIPLDVLRKVRDMVKEGLILVGPKPGSLPGLTGYPECDVELKRIVEEVWGNLNGSTVTERPFGKGRVFWGETMTSVLQKLKINPDFEFTSRSGNAPINYIHRRIGDSEVYFIANLRRQSEDLVCTFRVSDRRPEVWNPETGEIVPVGVFEFVDGRTRMSVRLGPAGSLFIVFRSPAQASGFRSITRNGVIVEGTKPYPSLRSPRYREVTNDFTISVWAMPDVDDTGIPSADAPNASTSSFMNESTFVIYPPAGMVYGTGHAACGLSAGRNGVIVFERSGGYPTPVLVVRAPLAGWTHLALVYQAGTPSLFVNGSLVRQGKKSGQIVHPGLGEPFQRDEATYFQGDMTKPKLFLEALTHERVQQLAGAGLPEPEGPPTIEPAGNEKSDLLIWQNGLYTLRGPRGRSHSVQISGISQPVEITGPWRVSFPPDLGAPSEVMLAKLISLHRHPEAGVRYFSGTATYTNRFHLAAKARDRRVYLDLGRVQVLAEVRVNSRTLGILWKPPFRVDVTDAVHEGENRLEVLVTNLWPNRLIGDEHLPPENEYGPSNGFFGGGIKKMPDWYLKGEPKPPGGRVTFSTWKHFDKDSALLESGLLGPVQLRSAALLAIGELK